MMCRLIKFKDPKKRSIFGIVEKEDESSIQIRTKVSKLNIYKKDVESIVGSDVPFEEIKPEDIYVQLWGEF